MGVRKLKPTTPGQRHRSVNDFAVLSSVAPEKSLTLPNRRSGGRNNTGKMTMRYVGGGAKQRYRIVDFKREKFNIPATVKSIGTIRTALRLLPCWFMPTVRSATSLRQTD